MHLMGTDILRNCMEFSYFSVRKLLGGSGVAFCVMTFIPMFPTISDSSHAAMAINVKATRTVSPITGLDTVRNSMGVSCFRVGRETKTTINIARVVQTIFASEK